MARIAIVTGGSRGIGAAISKALKAEGYTVVANYAGNDEAAQKFKAETGIEVRKWDVSDYAACETNLKKIENEVGPVDVLVNNAGITRDAMFHKMTPEHWYQVINTNLNSLFNMTRPHLGRHAHAGLRPRHLHLLDQRAKGADGPGQLFRGQGRRYRLRESVGAGRCCQGHHSQCDLSWLYRHRNGARRSSRGA